MLEPLTLVERRLHPQIGRARQNPFCERQDALYVEFFDLTGVPVNPRERELLAQLLGVTVVGLDVDGAVEEECFVQAVQLVLYRLGCALGARDLLADRRLSRPSRSAARIP